MMDTALVMKKILFVIGPYRSGTSLLSRIARELGAYPGDASDLYEPTDWNPEGYIQRPDVTLFNTHLIERSGGNLTHPPHPLEIASKLSRKDFVDNLDLSWISSHDIILIKDPRLCFTLLSWVKYCFNKLFDVRIIRISRDIDDNARSAILHYDVKKYCHNSIDIARNVICRYDLSAKWHCDNLGIPSIEVHLEKLVSQPEIVIRDIAKFIGLNNEKIIEKSLGCVFSGKSKISIM
jgi:hypothetical protein